MTVFLDTVGLLGVWDQSDQWHEAAQACFERLAESRADLITSTSVLLECGNAAARRPYRSAVSRLRAAWLAYENSEADSAGIVYHFSFTIMRRLGLSKAFTNDGHFRAAGFDILF